MREAKKGSNLSLMVGIVNLMVHGKTSLEHLFIQIMNRVQTRVEMGMERRTQLVKLQLLHRLVWEEEVEEEELQQHPQLQVPGKQPPRHPKQLVLLPESNVFKRSLTTMMVTMATKKNKNQRSALTILTRTKTTKKTPYLFN